MVSLFILASEFDVFIDWEMLILEVKFADFGPLLMDNIAWAPDRIQFFNPLERCCWFSCSTWFWIISPFVISFDPKLENWFWKMVLICWTCLSQNSAGPMTCWDVRSWLLIVKPWQPSSLVLITRGLGVMGEMRGYLCLWFHLYGWILALYC